MSAYTAPFVRPMNATLKNSLGSLTRFAPSQKTITPMKPSPSQPVTVRGTSAANLEPNEPPVRAASATCVRDPKP